MIRATMNYIEKPPPIPSAYIDGYLYVGIAIFGAAAASFATDEAAKYVSAQWLWYLRTGCSIVSAGLLALKMFRSTTFGQHLAEKAAQTAPTETANTIPTTETKIS
jgi:hypothetical protein